MFFEYLDRLRSKPEHIRYQIAFWCAMGITACVAFLYVATKFLAPEWSDGVHGELRKTHTEEERFATPAEIVKPDTIFHAKNVFEESAEAEDEARAQETPMMPTSETTEQVSSAPVEE